MADEARGIDISSYQEPPYQAKPIDWDLVKTANLDFVFVKVSEGNGYKANYQNIWEGAKRAGLLRSGYHYLHGEVNGHLQADYFMSHAQRGELPPAIDFEDANTLRTTAITGAAMMENLRVCLAEIENMWAIRPIIYTGFWFLWECFQESPTYDARWMAKYPLWIANYTYDPKIAPAKPSWWDWDFYQFSNQGSIPGIGGRVDLDIFKGTRASLLAYAGVSPTTVPTMPTEFVAQHAMMWSDYLERKGITGKDGV